LDDVNIVAVASGLKTSLSSFTHPLASVASANACETDINAAVARHRHSSAVRFEAPSTITIALNPKASGGAGSSSSSSSAVSAVTKGETYWAWKAVETVVDSCFEGHSSTHASSRGACV